jgi:hypothetical protein
MAYEKETQAAYASESSVRYLEERITRINERMQNDKKMLRLLIRILVDKKIIGPELAKTFEETIGQTPEAKELVEWFLKNQEGEENATG